MHNATASVLFGKTRRAVLTTLFEVPAERFYLRELVRLTGISPGALQQELQKLVHAELVIRAEDGNRVCYSANAAHPVFPELQSLIRKTCGLPAQVRTHLDPIADQVALAAIYGSVAKGTAKATSDVDLLVVGDVTVTQVLALLHPLEQQLKREVNARVYSSREFRERREHRDGFLDRVLSGPLMTLIGQLDDT